MNRSGRALTLLAVILVGFGSATCGAFRSDDGGGNDNATEAGTDGAVGAATDGAATDGVTDAAKDARPVFGDPILVGKDTVAGSTGGIFVCAMDKDALYVGAFTEPRRVEKDGGAASGLNYAVTTSTIVDMIVEDTSLYFMTAPFVGNQYLVRGSTAGGGAVVIGSQPKSPTRFTQTATDVFASFATDGVVVIYSKATWGSPPYGKVANGPFNGPIATDGTSLFAAEGDRVVKVPAIADASAPTPFLSPDAGGLVDLQLDQASGVLFWASHDTVGATRLSDGHSTVLATGVSVNVRIAFDATDVYWADTSGHRIVHVSRAGGGKQSLDANGEPVWVGLDAVGAYWCNTDGSVYVAVRQ